MASSKDWQVEEVSTTQLPDLTEVATGRLPDLLIGGPNGLEANHGSAPVAYTLPNGKLSPTVDPTANTTANTAKSKSNTAANSAPARKQSGRRASHSLPRSISKRDAANVREVQEQCRKLCLSLFFREPVAVRSVGFTSAVAGEGKTFLALATAGVLAADTPEPVVLIECNWDHPALHDIFDIPPQPGLAEWLRQECGEVDIRHRVAPNLIVIPAGDGTHEAVRLLQRLNEKSAAGMFTSRPERYVFDLPPVVSTSYGELACGVAESILVVVRAGATPDLVIAEACSRLKDLPVEGILLNRIHSRIPRWIQRML